MAAGGKETIIIFVVIVSLAEGTDVPSMKVAKEE